MKVGDCVQNNVNRLIDRAKQNLLEKPKKDVNKIVYEASREKEVIDPRKKTD